MSANIKSFFAIKIELCAKYGMRLDQFDSEFRAPDWQKAREEAWWLARQMTTMTYGEIGKLSNRDALTIRAGVLRHEARVQARRRKQRELVHG